jgi:hypothetical protein
MALDANRRTAADAVLFWTRDFGRSSAVFQKRRRHCVLPPQSKIAALRRNTLKPVEGGAGLPEASLKYGIEPFHDIAYNFTPHG